MDCFVLGHLLALDGWHCLHDLQGMDVGVHYVVGAVLRQAICLHPGAIVLMQQPIYDYPHPEFSG